MESLQQYLTCREKSIVPVNGFCCKWRGETETGMRIGETRLVFVSDGVFTRATSGKFVEIYFWDRLLENRR